jgi:murein DD-endopeptidase MepM/ murein hydrolase activator NlpD
VLHARPVPHITRRRRPPVAAVLALALVGTLSAAPARADRIGTAREQAQALRARLTALQDAAAHAVGRYEATQAELETVVAEHLAARTAHVEAEAATGDVQTTAEDRVRAIYIGGGRAALYVSAMQAGSPAELMSRMANIDAVVRTDAVTVDAATTRLESVAAQQARLHKAARAQIVLEQRAAAEITQINRLLTQQQGLVDSADIEVRRLLEEERERRLVERQRAMEKESARLAALFAAQAQAAADASAAAIAAAEAAADAVEQATGVRPPTGGGDATSPYRPAGGRYSCPVGPENSFIDSWHFPRSGGRRHQGTDVFAPHGSPAYAVTDGVIDKWGNGGLGGITLWLRADNGDRYYYAHNSMNLASVGTRIRAGDVIAYVGNTGNARTTPPHVHFEAHPGGGGAANPYPFLAAICGKL